jgi:predicted transcriptional regulator
MAKNITLSVTVDRDMEAALYHLSNSQNMSVSAIIRAAIERYLATKEGE